MKKIEIYLGDHIDSTKKILGLDQDSFTITTTLDESLDTGMFSVVTDDATTKALKSRDVIYIAEYEDDALIDKEHLFIVDVVGETVIKKTSTSTLYEYQVSFIEYTAKTQNLLCQNTSNTQPMNDLWQTSSSKEIVMKTVGNTLVSKYLSQIIDIQMKWTSPEVPSGYIADNSTLKARMTLPTINKQTYNRNQSVITPDGTNYYWEITKEDGTVVQSSTFSTQSYYDFQLTSSTPDTKYFISIYYSSERKSLGSFYGWDFVVYNVGNDSRVLDDRYHTAYDVLKRQLNIVKPYSNYVSTDYTIGDSCEFLKTIVCPDLYFTGNNLFENLIILGRTCNCIPYVDDDNAIQMLDLSANEDVPNTILSKFNELTRVSDYEGRVGGCIAELQNMIPSNKVGTGVAEDTWRMLEVDGGVQFTADSCYYKSDFPMYSLKQMLMRVWNADNTFKGEYDITSYMYESCQYACLDTTSDSNVNGILYALKWNQYGNKVEGFTAQTSDIFGQIDANHPTAIAKIMSIMTGDSIATCLNKWNERIMFKAIYVPCISARVKQYRADCMDFNDDQIILNQQTNLGCLETTGDSMKHSLQMLGNDSIVQKVFVENWSDVPTINQSVIYNGDRWKISKVVRSFSSTGYDLGIVYTKNFNRISATQSLATEKRWADVPLDGAINRTIELNDYLVISSDGDVPETDTTDLYIGSALGVTSDYLDEMFGSNYRRTEHDKITEFDFFLSDDVVNGAGQETVYSYPTRKQAPNFISTNGKTNFVRLPVVGGSFGNSIFLKANTLDNYAGVTGIIKSNNYYFGEYVPYSNSVGEGDYLNFMFFRSGQIDSTTFNANNTKIYTGLTDRSNWHSSKSVRKGFVDLFGTIGGKVYVGKDSRERLSFVYQLHFVKNKGDNEMIIGRALSEFNPITSNLGAGITYTGMIIKGNYDDNNTVIRDEDIIERFPIAANVRSNGTIKFYNNSDTRTFGDIVDGVTEPIYIVDAIEYTMPTIGYGNQHRCDIVVGRKLADSELENRVHDTVIAYADVRSDLPL